MEQDVKKLIDELRVKILHYKRAKLDAEEEYALGRITQSEFGLCVEQNNKLIELAEIEIQNLEPINTDYSQNTINRFVFISYARRDGRDLAVRLKNDLLTSGHKVWLDTAEIEGGTSWSNEIEEAIEQCDKVVALLSHASFVSEICRAEQLRALRKEKPVIPVLVQPNAERPIHLEHLNYRDFSDPSQYRDGFDLLLNDLQSDENIPLPEIRKHTIVSAPPLPPHFIARTEDLEFLRRTVIGDETDRQIALTALRGMGGIGKSVLATALCHDEIIQAAFPDGIIWVTIGREPGNLTEQMKFIGTKLGDSPGYYTSESAAADRLRILLAHKAILLVLDDVWDANYVLPFRIEAPRCRTLFTTRDSSIALTVGASEVRLGTLNREQALSLLLEWAGRNDDAMSDIADRLGYLPLALKLAGARLREGMSGREWLKTFQHVSQIKLGRRSRDPHENLEVCFDLSVQQLIAEDQLLYHAIGVFPEDVNIPQRVVVKLWRKLAPELSEYDANELAIDLSRLALIDRNAEDETITLHDLLHDYTRSKLGDKLQNTHLALLSAYNPRQDDWWKIPHDGYLYYQLGYHLIGAGQHQQFIALLIDQPDWMEAKFIACQGDIAYVADLDFAMRQYSDPLTTDDIAVVSQLFIARQIINVRASVYSDADFETLVWLGRTPEALNHARLRINPVEKYTGLNSIFRAAKESGIPASLIQDEMLRALRDIPEDVVRRTYMLECVSLLRHYNIDVHTALFREALFGYVPSRASEIQRIYQLGMRYKDTNLNISTMCFQLADDLAEGIAVEDNLTLKELEKDEEDTLSEPPLVLRLVQILLQERQFDEAIEITRCVPSERLLAEIALHLLELGEYETAIRTADQIPENASASIKNRTILLRQDAFSKFVSHFIDADLLDHSLTSLRKGNLEDSLHDALPIVQKLIEQKQLGSGLELLKKLNYKNVVSLHQLKKTLSELIADGKLDMVFEIIEIAVSRGASTEGWKLHQMVINTLIKWKRFDEALNIVKSLDERRVRLKLLLPLDELLYEAKIHYDAKEHDEARVLFQQALNLDSRCRDALWHLSLLTDTPQAQNEYLERLYEIDINEMITWSIHLYRNSQVAEATALIQRLLTTNSTNVMAHLWLSIFTSSPDQEVEYLQQVIHLDIRNEKHRQLGKPLQAMWMSGLEQATLLHTVQYPIKLGTGIPSVMQSRLVDLGVEALDSGNQTEAQMWFVRAVDVDPQDAKAWDWLSSVMKDTSYQQTCQENALIIEQLNPDLPLRHKLGSTRTPSGKRSRLTLSNVQDRFFGGFDEEMEFDPFAFLDDDLEFGDLEFDADDFSFDDKPFGED